MREIATGSQLNQNLSRFQWKIKGKRQKNSLQNIAKVYPRGSVLEKRG